jgi:oleate hydratase
MRAAGGRLGARRIDGMFSRHFFTTNFWQMWRTTFAFQNWHSAIELSRYFIRFVQEFPRIHTLSGVRRTVYNQYDSIVVPLPEWMLANHVDVRFAATATDADFADEGSHRRAVKLYYTKRGEDLEVQLGENDYLFMTLGSSAEVLRSTDVTIVMMPYASAVFGCRLPEDQPKVLPNRAANFAFTVE